MTWSEPDPGCENIVIRYPDGYEVPYYTVWDYGKPDMIEHCRLCDEEMAAHGGIPKGFLIPPQAESDRPQA